MLLQFINENGSLLEIKVKKEDVNITIYEYE